MKQTVRSRLAEKLPLLMAFMIPVLVLLVLYIGREVFPFGTNMFLRSDMYHQYAPFMREFQRNLKEGGSLLYSWNIGLGNNFAGTYAYYLASPLNFLVTLFPDTLIPEFMNGMILLKSGLMSAFFAYYLIRKFRKNGYTAAVFGCFYAMSAYMAAFSWNVMWLDCLVLFPLILLGLEALVREGRCRLYVITLALCAISNYYITIMISIFLIFYFVYLLICENGRREAENVIRRMILFVLYSLLAACISMFIILPALFNLFITASSDSAFPRFLTVYYNLLEMLAKSVINTEPAVFSGHFPNIYCTMAAFVLVPLFWISKRVPATEKAGKTILLLILGASFMLNIPTYIWHGFHFPNSLPCRYSFIYIFLVLLMGYQALINIRRFRVGEIVLCAAAGILGIFLLQSLYGADSITLGNACLGALFVLLYLLVLLLLRSRKRRKNRVMILLMLLCIAEIVINTNETGYSTTSRTAYMADNEAIMQMLAQVEDGSFYRVEKVTRRTKNDGAWNGYSSASVFSSTTAAADSDLYTRLGMQGRTNSYSYYGHTPVTQALLGVRYEIADEEQDDPLMTPAAFSDGYYLYENRYALGPAFLVNTAVYETVIPASDPFTYQNELLEKTCGVAGVFHTMNTFSGAPASFQAETGGRCLVNLTTDIERCMAVVERGGKEVFRKTFDSVESPQILDIGDVLEGDTIRISSIDDNSSYLSVSPAIMDYDRYDEAFEKLSAHQLSISLMEDTRIAGTVTAEDGQTMLTTIPYDGGWTLYVDGEQTEYAGYAGAFLAFSLPKGEHVIELVYWPQGLTAGIILSLAGLAALIILEIVRHRIMKQSV